MGQSVLPVGLQDSDAFLWDCPVECGTVGKYAITMHAWLCHSTCVHVLHNNTSLLWIHTYTLIMSVYTTYPQLQEFSDGGKNESKGVVRE